MRAKGRCAGPNHKAAKAAAKAPAMPAAPITPVGAGAPPLLELDAEAVAAVVTVVVVTSRVVAGTVLPPIVLAAIVVAGSVNVYAGTRIRRWNRQRLGIGRLIRVAIQVARRAAVGRERAVAQEGLRAVGRVVQARVEGPVGPIWEEEVGGEAVLRFG